MPAAELSDPGVPRPPRGGRRTGAPALRFTRARIAFTGSETQRSPGGGFRAGVQEPGGSGRRRRTRHGPVDPRRGTGGGPPLEFLPVSRVILDRRRPKPPARDSTVRAAYDRRARTRTPTTFAFGCAMPWCRRICTTWGQRPAMRWSATWGPGWTATSTRRRSCGRSPPTPGSSRCTKRHRWWAAWRRPSCWCAMRRALPLDGRGTRRWWRCSGTAPALLAARFGYVPVFDMLVRWSAVADPVLREVVESALSSRKLAARFGIDVARVRQALSASTPAPRNPDHDVGPTRDRSKSRRRRGR